MECCHTEQWVTRKHPVGAEEKELMGQDRMIAQQNKESMDG